MNIDITPITSSHNTQLKLVRKLHTRRGREQEQSFAVEGEDLVEAALDAGFNPRFLLTPHAKNESPTLAVTRLSEAIQTHGSPFYAVAEKLFKELSELAHPPRVIGVFAQPKYGSLQEELVQNRAPWIVLDGVADPGNVGTITRTVAALKAGGVIALPGTADHFGSKAARASMGACFRIPLLRTKSDDLISWKNRLRDDNNAEKRIIIALDAGSSTDLWDTQIPNNAIIVAGSERTGVSPKLQEIADIRCRVPQHEGVESMNVGVATAMALYEWHRQQNRATR